MANFAPSKKDTSDFNNGNKYINEVDDVQADTINNLVESQLYSQANADYAKALAINPIDTTDIANIGTPSLEIVEGEDGTPYLKASNFKGETGHSTWVGVLINATTMIAQTVGENVPAPKIGDFIYATTSNIGDSYIGNVYIVRGVLQSSENTYRITIDQADLAGNIRGMQGIGTIFGINVYLDENGLASMSSSDYAVARANNGVDTYVTLYFYATDNSEELPFAGCLISPNHGEADENYYTIEYNNGTHKVVITTCDDGHFNSVTYSEVTQLDIVQTTGESETAVMSQKAVTDELANVDVELSKKEDIKFYNYAKDFSFKGWVYPSQETIGDTGLYVINADSVSIYAYDNYTINEPMSFFVTNPYIQFDKTKVLKLDAYSSKAPAIMEYEFYDENKTIIGNRLSISIQNGDRLFIIKTENKNVKYIKIIRLAINAKGAAATGTKVVFKNLRIENRLRPTILFNFDIGKYDNRAEILEKNGFKGTFCSSNYTAEQIKELIKHGHDIGLYSNLINMEAHPEYMGENAYEDWYNYLKTGVDNMASNGYYYPTLLGCSANTATETIKKVALELGFKYIRCNAVFSYYNGDAGSSENIGYFNNISTNDWEHNIILWTDLGQTLNLANVIQTAIDSNQVLMLCTHLVEDTPTANYNTTTEIFKNAVAIVKEHYDKGECDVLTVREFYNKYHKEEGHNIDFTRIMSLALDNKSSS